MNTTTHLAGKQIIVCADDFAQSAEIDAGIITLMEQGKLSATSCMTSSPRWQQAAKSITQNIRMKADIGLHLDFTHFNSSYSLAALILLAEARGLSKQHLYLTINQQLDSFEESLGAAPDYVDGHQHVHQLPQIRDALLHTLAQRYHPHLPWIRIAKPPAQDGLKAIVISALGANAMTRQARKLGFKHSCFLLGVYGFTGNSKSYLANLGRWLRIAAQHTNSDIPVLMCHPAKQMASFSHAHGDPIYSARINEFEIMNSERFATLLNQYDLKIVRGSALWS